jgi:hypothetical protein
MMGLSLHFWPSLRFNKFHMPTNESAPPTQRMIQWIVVGLVLWGIIHAVGAYQFNYNPWRGVVVIASFAIFLSWWWWLLRGREQRLRRERQ